MNLPGTYQVIEDSNRSKVSDSHARPTCFIGEPVFDDKPQFGGQYNVTSSINGISGHVDNCHVPGEDSMESSEVSHHYTNNGTIKRENDVSSAFIARSSAKKTDYLNSINAISSSLGELSKLSTGSPPCDTETICEYDTIADFPKFSGEREISRSNASIKSIACLPNGVFTSPRHSASGLRPQQTDGSADAPRQHTPTISIYTLNSCSQDQLDSTSSTNNLVDTITSPASSPEAAPTCSRPSPKSKGAAMLKSLRSRGKKTLSLSNLLPQKNKEIAEPVKAVKFKSLADNQNSNGTIQCPSPRSQATPTSRHSILKSTSSPIVYKTSDEGVGDGKRFSSFHAASFKLEESQKKSKHKDHGTVLSTIEDGVRCDSPVIVRSGLCRCSNLSTQRGRRNHALMIMLVSVVPVIALLIQNSIDVYEQSARLEQHNVIKAEILFSVETGNVIHRTQIERGTTALYVSSKGDTGVLTNLTAAYQETDKAISGLTRWVVEPNIDHFRSSRAFHDNIRAFRLKLLSTAVPNITVPEVIKFYSDDNEVIMRWVGQFIQHSKSGDLWKTLVGYYMLILSKEQAGVERALGSTFYAQGGYNNKQMLDYLERKILGKTYLDRCTEYSTNINNYLKTVFIGRETDTYLQRMRSEILSNSLNGSDVRMGSMWFNNMTKYINILKVSDEREELGRVKGWMVGGA